MEELISVIGLDGVVKVNEVVQDKKTSLNTYYCNEIIYCDDNGFSRELILDSKDLHTLQKGDFVIISAMPDWYKVNVGAKPKSFVDQKSCSLFTALKNLFK